MADVLLAQDTRLINISRRIAARIGASSQQQSYSTKRDQNLAKTMLIVMKSGATEEQISRVATVVEEMGFRPHVMPGATRTAIGITGNRGEVDLRHFENLPGVAEAIRVSKPYKLISLDLRPDRTVVDLGDGARIGDGSLALIAGPCAVENREQISRRRRRPAKIPARASFAAAL